MGRIILCVSALLQMFYCLLVLHAKVHSCLTPWRAFPLFFFLTGRWFHLCFHSKKVHFVAPSVIHLPIPRDTPLRFDRKLLHWVMLRGFIASWLLQANQLQHPVDWMAVKLVHWNVARSQLSRSAKMPQHEGRHTCHASVVCYRDCEQQKTFFPENSCLKAIYH